MFSAFRPKPKPVGPPPEASVVGYDGDTLELSAVVPLSEGLQTVIVVHSELGLRQEAQVNVDQAFPEKQLYWASLPAESEITALLQPLIPVEVEMAAEAGAEPAPTWQEKRSKPRLNRILGVMSPQVEGFRCLTHDFHSDGLRLQLNKEVPAGSNIKVRFELEDHRLKPFDLNAEVRWCQPNPYKGGYWAGVRFTNIDPTQVEAIDKFIASVLDYESGVITRDYE